MIRLLIHNMARYPAGAAIGPAVWPHFDLIYVHDGGIELRLPGYHDQPMHLGPKEAILLYPQTSFEGNCILSGPAGSGGGGGKTSGTACFSVQHFVIETRPGVERPAPPFEDLQRRRRGFERFERPVAAAVEPDVIRAIDLARREQTPTVQQMRLAMLTIILGTLRDAPPPVLPGQGYGEAFERLIQWMQGRLDRGFTIKDLARQMHLSPSHFRSLFAREVGQSAGQFLLSLRMAEARRLLRDTQVPIKQVATQVGYSGLVPFSRQFKSHTGRTPAAYRRQSSMPSP